MYTHIQNFGSYDWNNWDSDCKLLLTFCLKYLGGFTGFSWIVYRVFVSFLRLNCYGLVISWLGVVIRVKKCNVNNDYNMIFVRILSWK